MSEYKTEKHNFFTYTNHHGFISSNITLNFLVSWTWHITSYPIVFDWHYINSISHWSTKILQFTYLQLNLGLIKVSKKKKLGLIIVIICPCTLASSIFSSYVAAGEEDDMWRIGEYSYLFPKKFKEYPYIKLIPCEQKWKYPFMKIFTLISFIKSQLIQYKFYTIFFPIKMIFSIQK